MEQSLNEIAHFTRMSPEIVLEVKTQELIEFTDVKQVIEKWEEKYEQENFDPSEYLIRLSEILEEETEQFMKLDPDPFDDRHPCRTHPNASLGPSLKALFRKETLISKLVHEYMRDRWETPDQNLIVNTAACRLFVNILPGLETSVVYQETEGLIMRLFSWSELGPEPLRSYALCLLGASMEIADVAAKFKDKNVHLVPLMLRRLRDLQKEAMKNEVIVDERPFVQFSKDSKDKEHDFKTPEVQGSLANGLSTTSILKRKRNSLLPPNLHDTPKSSKKLKCVSIENDRPGDLFSYDDLHLNGAIHEDFLGSPVATEIVPVGLNSTVKVPPSVTECSSSSWAELESNIIGSMKIYPVTISTKQIFILRYLSPLGEYQEMLSFAFENHAVDLILKYLDVYKTKDSRLTFEALKYLSSLLCHKKLAMEFIGAGVLPKMLQIPRPSISATGVSLCLYYLGYSEDIMEKICTMNKHILVNLVSYAMWLLECSHASGRNHAIMFFGVVYPFKIMLEIFDAQDGIRRILNTISTLPNFISALEDTDETQIMTRTVVRQAGYNLKKYFECHLGFLAEKLKRMQQQRDRDVERVIPVPPNKPLKLDPDKLRECNNLALDLMPLWARWHPVEKFIKLGGFQCLMQVIALAYDWNYSGRAETVKSVLDALGICCLVPRVQLLLIERVHLQGSHTVAAYGLGIILSAAEGEVVTDPDVQRAALMVIGNCVCGPMTRPGAALDFQCPAPRTPVIAATSKRAAIKTSEDILNKMWECVRVNNGILILTRLLLVKTPITDADSLRALACWCLSGLSRYKPVCQVLEQLPLVRSGLIQLLMKEPILQEKRSEHALFQKYALEITKNVFGKSGGGVEYELSAKSIHKSDLISQYRVKYNEKQLLELMKEHLLAKGLTKAAAVLASEANLCASPMTDHPSTSIATTSDMSPIVNGLPLPSSRPGKSTFGFKNTVKPNVRKVTLDSIVKEYLTNQHSLCEKPMAVCPTFDLFVPHECPAIRERKENANFAARFSNPAFDWSKSSQLNRKLVYSKFRTMRMIRASEEDHFTTAAFSSCNQWTIVGTHQGEVKLFNIATGNEDGTYTCHDSELHHVQPNRKGNLLLTSSIWRRPLSALWRMDSLFDKLIEFDRDEYVEFSKLTQDKIIATNMEHASVYDIETKKKILSVEPRMSNGYTKNRATFDPTDDLILCDGVLWDFRSGREIHKFDKLNESINGVFHPTGLEIIANTEVWDVRTFRLLRTVRALDQCQITFTNDGNIMYGVKCEKETIEGYKTADTSFITLDSTSYERIGIIELKRSIYSLATSPNDLQIVLVENGTSDEDSISDSVVRFYEVGRTREIEEEMTEDVEDEEDELQEETDDDDDDDIDIDEEDNNDEDGLEIAEFLDEFLPDVDDFEVDEDGGSGSDDSDDSAGEVSDNPDTDDLFDSTSDSD